MKRILYLGPQSGTCRDRANALRRLGYDVDALDLRTLLPDSLWVDRITWRLGGGWFDRWLLPALARRLRDRRYDLCHVDGGEWVTPRVITQLRRHAPRIINYNIDDPLGPRDGARSSAYRRSLPSYDLCVVMRPQNVNEALSLGARDVMQVSRSADEVSHAPRQLSEAERRQWASDVLFLGTWFPERGPFLLELIRLGVPLSIRGSNWQQSPEWPVLQPHWLGGHIEGEDYARAIQCARVSLGLLSKGNRDLHTTRSLEIPALGGLLCAERTSEHLSMYREGKEALFWSGAGECAEMCRYALSDEQRRRAIAAAGHERVRSNGHYNEPILQQIMARAMAGVERQVRSC